MRTKEILKGVYDSVVEAINDHTCCLDLEQVSANLGEVEADLNVLEILKTKEVNIGDVRRCKNVDDYNKYYTYNKKPKYLTQNEFFTIKRWLRR